MVTAWAMKICSHWGVFSLVRIMTINYLVVKGSLYNITFFFSKFQLNDSFIFNQIPMKNWRQLGSSKGQDQATSDLLPPLNFFSTMSIPRDLTNVQLGSHLKEPIKCL